MDLAHVLLGQPLLVPGALQMPTEDQNAPVLQASSPHLLGQSPAMSRGTTVPPQRHRGLKAPPVTYWRAPCPQEGQCGVGEAMGMDVASP